MKESVSIGFRTDVKTAQTLAELAARMERTRNNMLNVIVKKALATLRESRQEEGKDGR